MKKITIIAVALIAVSFASCKKAKTCSCSTTYTKTNSGISVSSVSTDVTSYDKISKEDANILCPKTSTTTDPNGGSPKVWATTCTLS